MFRDPSDRKMDPTLRREVYVTKGGAKAVRFVCKDAGDLPTALEGAVDGDVARLESSGEVFEFRADPRAFRGGWSRIGAVHELVDVLVRHDGLEPPTDAELKKIKSRADAKRLSLRLRGRRVREPGPNPRYHCAVEGDLPAVAADGEYACVKSSKLLYVFNAVDGVWVALEPFKGEIHAPIEPTWETVDQYQKRMSSRPPPGVAVPTHWLRPPKHPMARCSIDLTAEDPPTRVDPLKVRQRRDRALAERVFSDGTKAATKDAPEVRVGGRYNVVGAPEGDDAILLFGKYRGQKVSRLVVESPEGRDYLRWVMREEFPDELKTIIEFWLNKWGYKA